jgi:hypothetical protein
MTRKRSNKIPELFRQLSEGFSKQQKFAANCWIALAVVSTLTVMPKPMNGSVKLPFFLTEVPIGDFYPFALVLLSLFVISYGSATCQAVRARMLIQKYIDKSRHKFLSPAQLHIQDIFDSIVPANINRVAPLAQILLGKHQFFSEIAERPVGRLIISVIYFILLRLVGILVIEIFPFYALLVAFFKGNLFSCVAKPWNIPVYFFWFLSFVAFLVLLELLCLDVAYALRSIGRICSSQSQRKLGCKL